MLRLWRRENRRRPHDGMWRRSVCLAMVMHTGISLAMLHYAGLGLGDVSVGALEPIVRADLVEFEAGLNVPIHGARPNESTDATGQTRVAIEPSMALIREVTSFMLEEREKEAGPDAMEELVRKAKLLERISSPQAVSSISVKIRHVLGTRDEITSQPATDGPVAVDIATCQLIDVVRVESEGVVEIRETLTDRAGFSLIVVSVRRTDPATGEAAYEEILIEPGQEPVRLPSDKEAFEAALARYRPFRLIHRFPLIKQLHRQAVLPILDKLTSERDPTTQPGGETPP